MRGAEGGVDLKGVRTRFYASDAKPRFNLYPVAAHFLLAARTSFRIAPLRPLPEDSNSRLLSRSLFLSQSLSMKYDDDSIGSGCRDDFSKGNVWKGDANKSRCKMDRATL